MPLWEAMLTVSTATFLMAHEIHHIELDWKYVRKEKQMPGLLDRLYAWSWLISYPAYDSVSNMWNKITFPIYQRSLLIINELKEGLGNDEVAHSLLKACESSIMSWTQLYNVFYNMQEVIEDRCDISEIGKSLEESYCDIMALYDVLLEETDCTLGNTFFVIDTIIKSLAIQETHHMMEQMLQFVQGKIREIRPRHLRRIQFFLMGILFEMLALENPKFQDDLIQVDWSNIPKSFTVNHEDIKDVAKMISFDVLRRFSDMPNFKNEVRDYFEGTMQGLDEIHEYYYKTAVYTFFHALQDGFITKDFKGLYLKRKSNDSEENLTLTLDLNAVTNAVTHDEMLENVRESMRKEKKKHPKIIMKEIDTLFHITYADKIQRIYAEMHNNKMITDELENKHIQIKDI